MATDRSSILNSVNALRGFAALMVCLYHAAYLIKESQPFLYDILFWGQEGVYVFYVISALVLPWSMEHSSFKWSDTGGFLLKRLLRLHPPFILAALCFLVYMNWWQPHVLYSWPVIKNFIFNITYLAPWFGEHWILDVFWFLPVQFQFYIAIALLFPLLIHKNDWIRRLVLLAFFCLCFLNVFISQVHEFVKDAIFFHAPVFTMGIALFWYAKQRIGWIEFLIWIMLASVIAFETVPPRIAMVSIGTVVVLLFLKRKIKIFDKLGDISYSFYLTHFIFISIFGYFISPYSTTVWQKYLLLAGIVVSSVLFAKLFYWVIEKPSARWSKAIKYK
ncbi:MAG: acyltransferase [Crocinitomicaceae bacterium]|nr:acyltransferase [Crocinitomicaceae bacterium]